MQRLVAVRACCLEELSALSMGDMQRHRDRAQGWLKMLQQTKQGSSPKALGKGLHLGKHHRLLGQSAEALGLLPRILPFKV